MHSIQHWSFILLGGYDIGTLGQIGGYYLARVGSQVPAIGFAAFIISRSDFRHPVRTACLTVFAYHGIMTAIRIARNPWSVAPNFDQSIAVLAEMVQLVLIVGFMAVFAPLMIWLRTGPLARLLSSLDRQNRAGKDASRKLTYE
jgi:hypothetical protein